MVSRATARPDLHFDTASEGRSPMAVRLIDERELVLSYQSGDASAFQEIVRVYREELLGHAMRRLGDRVAAEDAVQETLLRAYAALDRFNGRYELGSWLHRILANVCTDEQRRRSREAETCSRLAAVPARLVPTPELAAEAELARRRLASAIEALPTPYRDALILRELEDLQYREVARAMGVSEDNARTRVRRARIALRAILLSTSGATAWVLGIARRLHRGIGETTQAAAQSVGGSDPVISQAIGTVGTSLPAKAAIASGLITTIAAAVTLAPHLSPAPTPRSAPLGAVAPAHGNSIASPALASSKPATSPATPTTLSKSSGSSAATATGNGAAPAYAATGATTGRTGAASPSTTPAPSGSSSTPTAQTSSSATGAPAPQPSSSPPPPSPSSTSTSGQLASSGLPVSSGATQVTTSGDGKLTVSSGTLTGSITVRASLPASTDSQTSPSGWISILFTFTQSDGTLARVDLYGHLVSMSSANGVRTYQFQGTLTGTGGQSQGVPQSGTFSGQLAIDDTNQVASLNMTLTGS